MQDAATGSFSIGRALGIIDPEAFFAQLVVRKMSGYHPRSLREEIGLLFSWGAVNLRSQE